MTALYCYMVSFYNYSDSEFLPIFHEKKFTKEEFQKISTEIAKKYKITNIKNGDGIIQVHF